MQRFLNFIRVNLRDIGILAGFLSASVVIVYLLPREGRFMFEYQKGGFWKHEDLTAPFAFPVYKSAQELQQERDSVLDGFRPIFDYIPQTGQQRIQEFSEQFSSQWCDYTMDILSVPNREIYRTGKPYSIYRRLENEYKAYIAQLLREVYDQGIIETSAIETRGSLNFQEVTVVRNNLAEQADLRTLYTPLSAYEHLSARLRNSIPQRGNAPVRKYSRFFDDLQLNNYLSANVLYNEEKSEAMRRNLISSLSLTRGLVAEGQGIISKGEFINDQKFSVLESLRVEYERNLGFMARQLVIIGKFILVFSSLFIIFLFLKSYRKEVLENNARVAFILLTLVMMVLIAGTALKYNLVSVYVLPFTILPIMLRTFFDSRLALFIHIITVLLVGFFVPNGFEFVFLNVVAGMVAIISLTNVYRRSKFVVTSLYVLISYSVLYLGISLVQEGDLHGIDLKYFTWFALNGMLIMIAYPLIYLFEKTFGFISDATLMELSDTNQPLLRKLAELAPGTFQHSLQVANLAEDAVFHVGGNPLLVRTGALYHDIGKMSEPLYFIENQTNAMNPHDELEFEQSAGIIIDHVRKGVELAKKYKLPEPVVDFIRTHHGTTTVQFFYKSYLRKYPEAEVDVNRFSYPGPRPHTKETAIVMMADSVEAASRSLKAINEESIDKLVDSIIERQMTDEQYNEAQITFREITNIREVFKKRLKNIYHVRISYQV